MTVFNASSVVYQGQILANYWYIALHLFQVLYENLSYCGRLRNALWVLKTPLIEKAREVAIDDWIVFISRLRVPNFREFAFRFFFSAQKKKDRQMGLIQIIECKNIICVFFEKISPLKKVTWHELTSPLLSGPSNLCWVSIRKKLFCFSP